MALQAEADARGLSVQVLVEHAVRAELARVGRYPVTDDEPAGCIRAG